MVAPGAPVVVGRDDDPADHTEECEDPDRDCDGRQSSAEVGHAEAVDAEAHESVAEDGHKQQGHGDEADDVPLAGCLLEEGVGVLLQQHPPEERQ